jgi:hypothetical protein
MINKPLNNKPNNPKANPWWKIEILFPNFLIIKIVIAYKIEDNNAKNLPNKLK